jgi:hypothetical protein
MKRLLSDYYTKWYIPLFVTFIFGFICLKSSAYPIAFYISLSISLTSLVISFILGIVKMIRKQYGGGLQVLTTTFLIFAGLVFFALFRMFTPFDHYADNLKIPHNLKLEIPKKYRDSDSQFKESTDFNLYNSFQPGIYTYDVSINKTGKGKVFLKAFELTQNDPLSVENLKLDSAIPIKANDTITYYRLKGDFTIHEGDWERPYAARFELWFRDDETGKETKLAQKFYKIEGWMR